MNLQLQLTNSRTLFTASALSLILSACGGGGGSSAATAAPVAPAATPPGTGGAEGGGSSDVPTRQLSGSIDGFGSVFVGGVRFATDNADVIINGMPASERDLAIGMVVGVTGSVNDDGATGTATRIEYNDDLTGPIESIEVSADGDALLLVVLGFNVIVERIGTTFDDADFDSLSVGDVVEVSGFPAEGNRLRATRIEGKGRFVPGSSPVELRGVARNVTAAGFTLGAITVDTALATIDEDDGALVDGKLVEVRGTVQGGVLSATFVETEDGRVGGLQPGDVLSLQGTISSYISSGDFRVRGVDVDASSAIRSPASLQLADGLILQVDGTWDGERLVAERISSRRGRIEIEAPVAALRPDSGEIDLALFAGTVTITVDGRTRLEDDRNQGVDRLTFADLVAGDFLEVEALLDGDRLVATDIDRDDPDEEVLQAPVDAFNAGMSITLLGLTYSLEGTRYETVDDARLSSEDFFAALQIGDLVKLTDNEPDGIANELEFEDEGRLDGEREFGCGFDDDSTSCDDDDLLDDDTRSDDDDLTDEDDDQTGDDLTDDDEDQSEDDDLTDDDEDQTDDDLTDDDDDQTDDDDLTDEDGDQTDDDDS